MEDMPSFGTQVKTPYGVGKVQGRLLKDGYVLPIVKLIVVDKMPPAMKEAANSKPMVLWAFNLRELEVI